MKVRRDRRRRGHDLDQFRCEVRRKQRREPDPAEPGDLGEPPKQRGEARARKQVGAVVPQVDPGEHELGVAGLDQTLGLIEHALGVEAAAGAAREGHDAERATMLAAVLDLQERARPPADPDDRRRVQRGGVGDVGDVDAVGDNLVEQVREPRLVPVADDQIDLRHRGDVVRAGLGPASGHDELGAVAHPRRAADHLAVGELGARRDRARVDHHHVRGLVEGHGPKATGLERRLDLLRVHLIEAAPQRRERDGAAAGLSHRPLPLDSPKAGRTRRRRLRPCSSGRSW